MKGKVRAMRFLDWGVAHATVYWANACGSTGIRLFQLLSGFLATLYAGVSVAQHKQRKHNVTEVPVRHLVWAGYQCVRPCKH